MQRAAQRKSQRPELQKQNPHRRHEHSKDFQTENKHGRIKQTCPTVISLVTDALVFGVEDGFLQHAENDDRTDPELDPQQIPPIAGTPEEPERPEQHVHDAHHHEELRREEPRETHAASL